MSQPVFVNGNNFSFRIRNNFSSPTTFDVDHLTNSCSTTNPLNINGGATSIQQFFNGDLFSSLSRSCSQPDLTGNFPIVQSNVNQLSSSKSMSNCSDEIYMDMIEAQSSNTIDDLLFGFETDFQFPTEISDLFENDYFSNFNERRSLFQQTDNSSSLHSTMIPQRSAPNSPKIERNNSRRCFPTKLWSKMNKKEQNETIEELIQIINDQLGRREQLEIIRIVQPDGTEFLPDQTEIRVDFSSMNDEKHRRIRNIIKFHLIGISKSNTDQSDGDSSLSSNKSDPLEKKIEKAFELRQKKEKRQAAKEHRSGLFNSAHHQVLQLTKCDEDIEVDILS